MVCGVGNSVWCGLSVWCFVLGCLGFRCGVWFVVCGLWCGFVVCGVWCGWVSREDYLGLVAGSLGELHAILAYVGKYVE